MHQFGAPQIEDSELCGISVCSASAGRSGGLHRFHRASNSISNDSISPCTHRKIIDVRFHIQYSTHCVRAISLRSRTHHLGVFPTHLMQSLSITAEVRRHAQLWPSSDWGPMMVFTTWQCLVSPQSRPRDF